MTSSSSDGLFSLYVISAVIVFLKDEGELTGGKRLIERLKKRHGHFADVIVADALYLNAPFINTLKENGLEGCPYKLRVVRYHEQWEENGKERERFM